jgi:calcineurin-like phosphoesterase family protein
MARWFTSDTHYWHTNVIRYCNRPWATVEEMNAGLIERHNAVVKPQDDVYHMGDLAMAGTKKIAEVMRQLNGRHHLVMGNHDFGNIKPHRLDLGFASINPAVETFMEIAGHKVSVGHFPYRGASGSDTRYEDQKPVYQGLPRIHGHVHQAWRELGPMLNVGVDVWDYRPVSEDEVGDWIRNRSRWPLDKACGSCAKIAPPGRELCHECWKRLNP